MLAVIHDIWIFCLLSFHTSLVLKGQTTYESIQCCGSPEQGYDRGWRANLADFLGFAICSARPTGADWGRTFQWPLAPFGTADGSHEYRCVPCEEKDSNV